MRTASLLRSRPARAVSGAVAMVASMGRDPVEVSGWRMADGGQRRSRKREARSDEILCRHRHALALPRRLHRGEDHGQAVDVVAHLALRRLAALERVEELV